MTLILRQSLLRDRRSFLSHVSSFQAHSVPVVDPCILVNTSDENVGIISKSEAHLLSNIQRGMLHRAFSVFLFSTDRKTLLLQKRAPCKITFPNMTSNSCCSHPQHNYPGEVEEAGAIGVKRAASRRLSFELGLRENAVKPEDFHYINRIHYYVRNVPEDNKYGEHEIDYILFAFADLSIGAPNLNEVSKCWYVNREELQAMLLKRPQDFTPWFRLIADNFLFDWWARIHKLDCLIDHKQWMTFARTWWLYDARWQCAMKSAERVGIFLEGRHKPIYSPLTDCGDYVVIMNARHVAMEGELWKHWTYFWHTGYPGRLHKWRAWQLHEEDPTKIMKKEIYRRLPKDWSRQRAMARLFVFPDAEIPEDIMKNISNQIRQVQVVPRRLDEFSQQEIEGFPQIANLREDHAEKYVVVDETGAKKN